MKYSLLSTLVLVALAGCSTTPTTDDANSSVPAEQAVSSEMNTISSEAVVSSSFAAVQYVGMTVADAEAMAQVNNVPFRVVKEDGVDLAATMDYVPGRINAEVEAGKVVRFTVEGNEQ